MSYQIYTVKNKINGKLYIGVHCGDIFEDDYYGSGVLIQNIIDKYGKNNLERNVISEHESERLAYFVERMLVGEDVVKDAMFYNLMEGGRGRSVGTVLSDKTKKKIGESNSGQNNGMFGYQYSKKQKERISNFWKNWHENNEHPKGFLGKSHSKEWKERVSKINSKLSKDRKKVVHIKTDKMFNSITEAAEYFDVSLSTVSHHCNDRVNDKKFKFYEA